MGYWYFFFFTVFNSGENQYRVRQRALQDLAPPALGLAPAQSTTQTDAGKD